MYIHLKENKNNKLENRKKIYTLLQFRVIQKLLFSY